MADALDYMKAVEFGKTGAALRKRYGSVDELPRPQWMMQKKYDGCFAKFQISSAAVVATSRTGELVLSCAHIEKSLRAWWYAHCGKACFVFGEIWHPTHRFPWISGKFRQQRPCEELMFVANDIVPFKDFAYGDSRTPYIHRLDAIEHVSSYRGVMRAEEIFGRPTEVAAHLVAEGGYDGAIMRDTAAGWTTGRAKLGQIIKVKPVMTLDLRVVDRKIEVGEKTGRPVLTLAVEYRGVTSWVGSGVPHDLHMTAYDKLTSGIVGEIIEVECMGLTADGKLREPRFKGVRYDKDQPDT